MSKRINFSNGGAKTLGGLLLLISCWLGSVAHAQTVVTVTTPLGDFSIQLLDELGRSLSVTFSIMLSTGDTTGPSCIAASRDS